MWSKRFLSVLRGVISQRTARALTAIIHHDADGDGDKEHREDHRAASDDHHRAASRLKREDPTAADSDLQVHAREDPHEQRRAANDDHGGGASEKHREDGTTSNDEGREDNQHRTLLSILLPI